MRFLLAALFAIPLILGAPAEGDAAGKNKNKGKGGPTLTTTQGKADKGKPDGVSTAALVATIISATERALIVELEPPDARGQCAVHAEPDQRRCGGARQGDTDATCQARGRLRRRALDPQQTGPGALYTLE